jgi:hypothetical protein
MSEFFAFFLGLFTNEVGEVAPWLSEKIINKAVQRLPKRFQGRYRAEYLGDLDMTPGKVTKILFAIQILFSVEYQRAILSDFEDFKLAKRWFFVLLGVSVATIASIGSIGLVFTFGTWIATSVGLPYPFGVLGGALLGYLYLELRIFSRIAFKFIDVLYLPIQKLGE